MPRPDFATITEVPGRTVGADQFGVICTRYAFAAQYASGRRVLEAGFGSGLGLGVLARRARLLVGGELMRSNIDQARTIYAGRRDVRLVQLNAHHLPFRDGAFDAVLAMAVIYYLDLDRFLRECGRVLVPEGIIVFCTPNRDAPGFRPGRLTTFYYPPADLVSIFGAHGFELELFVGFPAFRRRARLASRIVALGGTVLANVPFSSAGREAARRAFSRVIGFERHYLPPELREEDVAGAAVQPLVPLAQAGGATIFRIIYGLARRA